MFFFSSRRRHTRWPRDWSSDVCSSDLHPATVAHLRQLGITTIELLPIHAKADEPALARRALSNYWGYNTLSFFAPEPSYATAASRTAGAGAVVDEVAQMVADLHAAGLERSEEHTSELQSRG